MRRQLRQIKKGIRRHIHPELYPWGSILMLHRIDNIDPDRLWYNEHLKISPSFLDDTLSKLQKRGFSFVPLDELADIINRKKKTRRIISITLDDGYKDNYTNGLPIFKAHNVPFCIYVATKLPEKKMTYWWYLLEDIIQQKKSITLSDGSNFICHSKQEKEQVFLDIREKILTIPHDNFNEHFAELFPDIDIDLNRYNDTLPLTWKMLLQLSKEPLATIGCHTHSHGSFATCTNKSIIEDIEYSKHLMQTKANVTMHHFAFPFGDDIAVRPEHISLIRGLGFNTISTTQEGLLYYSTDLQQLPRVFFTEHNASAIIEKIYHEC